MFSCDSLCLSAVHYGQTGLVVLGPGGNESGFGFSWGGLTLVGMG